MANQALETRKEKYRSLQNLFEVRKEGLANLLPPSISVDRLIQVALASVSKAPALLECTQESWVRALLDAAQLGLLPSSVTQHAHLLPFKNTRANCMEVQLIPGYRGFIHLAYQSGLVASIYARVVHELDSLEIIQGSEEKIVHTPYVDGQPGAFRLVYAVAKLREGDQPLHEIMRKDQVEWVRSHSKAGKDSPWNDKPEGYEEQSKKSAVRRLYKYLPSSPDMEKAMELDNREYDFSDPIETTFSSMTEEQDSSPAGRNTASHVKERVRQKAAETEKPAGLTSAQEKAILEALGNAELSVDNLNAYLDSEWSGVQFPALPAGQVAAILKAITEGEVGSWIDATTINNEAVQ